MRKPIIFMVLTVCVLVTMDLSPASPAARLQQSDESSEGSRFINVSPVVVELYVEPGKTKTRQYKVDNFSDNEITVDAFIQNFEAEGRGGTATYNQEDGPFSMIEWSAISPKSATISPGETADYLVTLSPPEGLAGGGKYGAATFRPRVVDSSEGNKITTITEVAGLMFVTIPGEYENSGEIESFRARGKKFLGDRFYSEGPTSFVAAIKNTGEVHAAPSGTITIKNLFGKTVDTLKLPDGRVLPGQTRDYKVAWNPRGTLWGRYVAHLEVEYGNGQVFKKQITFVVVPPKQTGIVFIVIFLLLLAMWLLRFRIAGAFAGFLGSGRDKKSDRGKKSGSVASLEVSGPSRRERRLAQQEAKNKKRRR